MSIESVSIDSTSVALVLRIPPSERTHETARGECYLRVGGESRRLNSTQRRELADDRGTSQSDGESVDGVSITDLDEGQRTTYRAAIGTTGIEAGTGTHHAMAGGEGIRRMFDEMRRSGFTDPV